jgi:Zn-dependent peptidase ImmA (M78 family)
MNRILERLEDGQQSSEEPQDEMRVFVLAHELSHVQLDAEADARAENIWNRALSRVEETK